ncbi:MAG: branched-chain amino acid ABC transporter permease [Bauldia sp.]|nr:branched-chain amino acid ABC transporter permease [Bauldia sp.]
MTEFLIYLATTGGIAAMLALSLNLQYGLAGLVNLGQIAFFMIGGYVSAIIVMLGGQTIAIGILGGTVAAALFGILMALPTARLRQDYWAISTLAAAEIVRLFFLNTAFGSPYFGQAFGIDGIPQPYRRAFTEAGLTTSNYNLFYLGLVLVSLLAIFLILRWLAGTPFGRTLKAIREGDHVPLALGKKVSGFRLRAMAIGGAVGGFAGALFAHYNAFINPEYFVPIETFIIWAMVILGGAGNFLGAVVGTVIITTIYNSTRFIASFASQRDLELTPIIGFIFEPRVLGPLRMVLIGLMILLVILYLPRGLVPERRRRYGR